MLVRPESSRQQKTRSLRSAIAISSVPLISLALFLFLESCSNTQPLSSSKDSAEQPIETRAGHAELVDFVRSPTNLPLSAVRFADPMTGWIAGRSGTLLATTDGGTSWNPQPTGVDDNFIDLDFVDRQTGWAASNHALLKTSDGGKTWEQIWDTTALTGIVEKAERNLPSEAILIKISFASRKRGWALGLGWDVLSRSYHVPLVLSTRDGGTSWEWQVLEDDYATMKAIDERVCVIAGKFGRFAQTTDSGQSWERRNIQSEDDFLELSFSGKDRGWAVGSQGSIISSKDGGKTWTVSYSPRAGRESPELRAIRFATDLFGVAAGFENYSRPDQPAYALIVLSTYDGGRSWTRKEITTFSFSVGSITLAAQDTGWVVGSGGQIVRFRIPA